VPEDVIGDIPIKMISYEDPVALKEQASRPEDLADLQRLRQAREGSDEGAPAQPSG
jgi:predicted nucleotidyltransferase